MNDETNVASAPPPVAAGGTDARRNADEAESRRFAALAPRWWSSAPRLRDALKRIARGVRGSGRDAGRTTRQ